MLASVRQRLSFSQRLATWLVTLLRITVEGGEELSEAESMEAAAEASIFFSGEADVYFQKDSKTFQKVLQKFGGKHI